jgi:hypothetical protein
MFACDTATINQGLDKKFVLRADQINMALLNSLY